MGYQVLRINGRVVGVLDDVANTTHPKDTLNRGWREFLSWNETQNPRLDVSDSFDLASYKKEKIAVIQAKSADLLKIPVVVNGRPFGVGPDAERRWNSANAKKGKNDIFPLKVLTVLGRRYVINNAAELDEITDAVFDRGKQINNGEVDLIEDVMTSVNKAAVDAVVDNRT